MDSWKLLLTLTVILYAVTSFSCVGQQRGDVKANVKYVDEAVQIVNTIFHNYKEIVPPRKHYPQPVSLGINLHVLYVSDLDPVAQTLTSTVELEVTWLDMRLSWYPLAVNEITIPPSKVWIPNLSMNNAIGAPSVIEDEKYVIKSSGQLYMYKRMQITTTCQTNSSYDRDADCEITVGSNLLNSEIIDFDMNTSSCDVDTTASSHRVEGENLGPSLRYTERNMLKVNATFPELACGLYVRLTGCCGPARGANLGSSMFNGSLVTRCSILAILLALMASTMACLY